MISNRNAGGLRRSPFIPLTDEEINFLKDEIKAIEAEESVFEFVNGRATSYRDETDKIYVKKDVFPDLDSIHPRDLLSPRAVLAHEYYGHRANRNSSLDEGSWNDEFRASYMAALNTPNLSDKERAGLILDAIERAREAGVTIKYNEFMRRTLYGG